MECPEERSANKNNNGHDLLPFLVYTSAVPRHQCRVQVPESRAWRYVDSFWPGSVQLFVAVQTVRGATIYGEM